VNDAALRNEIRYRLLILLDGYRPQMVLESLLLRSLKDQGLMCDRNMLRRELDYMASLRLIEKRQGRRAGENGEWVVGLLAKGVDWLEGNTDRPEWWYGEPFVRSEILRRHEIRWRLLRMLDAGRPIPVTEGNLYLAFSDSELPLTVTELRRAVVYLEQKGLVVLNKRREDDWKLELTAKGVDVAEYSADAPPGIGRVEKYW